MEFFKNVTNAQLRTALLVLLAVLLLWGGLKLIFGIGFGPLVDQLLPNGVMIGAVAIFAWNRWLVAEQRKQRDAEEADEKSKEEETPPPAP